MEQNHKLSSLFFFFFASGSRYKNTFPCTVLGTVKLILSKLKVNSTWAVCINQQCYSEQCVTDYFCLNSKCFQIFVWYRCNDLYVLLSVVNVKHKETKHSTHVVKWSTCIMLTVVQVTISLVLPDTRTFHLYTEGKWKLAQVRRRGEPG